MKKVYPLKSIERSIEANETTGQKLGQFRSKINELVTIINKLELKIEMLTQSNKPMKS